MKLKLWQFPYSPFCIPVIRVLDAARVDYESIEIPSWDKSAVIELTQGAYYQVPAIQHGDAIVYESGDDTQDLPRYLDRTFLGGKLFPEKCDGLQSILNRYLENDVEGVTFKLNDAKRIPLMENLVGKTMLIRHKERKFGRGCVQRWARKEKELLADLADVLAPVESALKHSRYLLSGHAPVYADFLLYGMLGNLTYGGLNEIPSRLPSVQRHYLEMAEFSFQKT